MKSFISHSTLSLLLITCLSQTLNAANAPTTSTYPAPAESAQNAPSFGVNVEPVWLLLGGLGAKLEYYINDTVSVGVGGIFIPSHRNEEATRTNSNGTTTSVDSYNWEHNEAYIGSNIMLTGTLGTRGLYINPAIGFQNTRISDFGTSKLSGELSSPAARLTLGYQWVIINHLRLAAGGGFMLAQESNIIIKDSSGKEVLNQKSTTSGGLALDLQIGYVF
ncbi:MAG: hypothetical protein H7061_03505 [Bdellovibrionaceae bacterium]|nr:hypothetical protein [Bdellovibrio sp.]